MGRLIELITDVAASADEAGASLTLSPADFDRLRDDWGDDEIEDALALAQTAFHHEAVNEAADSLSFAALAAFAAGFLAAGGLLTVLLPPPEMRAFEQVAAAVGLHATTRLVLRHRPGSRPLRHITGFRHAAGAVLETALTIRAADDDAQYSPAFRALLAGFYLAL